MSELIMVKFHKWNKGRFYDKIYMYKNRESILKHRPYSTDNVYFYDLNKEDHRINYIKKYWELNKEGNFPEVIRTEEDEKSKKYFFKNVDDENMEGNWHNYRISLNDWCDFYSL